MRSLFIFVIFFMTSQFASAYESAFPKTDVNVIEIKTVPAATLLVARSEDNYFDKKKDLFRPLFRYIQTNDIPMTVPVEADINPGAMYFYVDSNQANKTLEDTDEVNVIQLPERTVISIGVRGSYSEKNFNKARETLIAYLAGQDDWIQAEPARAIYWNGPFTLGFLKRSEVHIPIERKKDS